MTATCYLCDHGFGTIPGLTKSNKPEGSCKICGVFSCAGHGRRDRNVRRYECVACVPSLLVSSAVARDDRAAILFGEFRSESDPLLLVATVDEFLRRWPSFRNRLVSAMQSAEFDLSRTFTTEDTELAWHGMGEDARQLVAAAIAVARIIGAPPDELPSALAPFVDDER